MQRDLKVFFICLFASLSLPLLLSPLSSSLLSHCISYSLSLSLFLPVSLHRLYLSVRYAKSSHCIYIYFFVIDFICLSSTFRCFMGICLRLCLIWDDLICFVRTDSVRPCRLCYQQNVVPSPVASLSRFEPPSRQI